VGWAVGFILFLPLFALKGMGAGDVKLLAAIGAWLGPLGALWTGLYGAVVGGVMALVFILGGHSLRRTARTFGMLFRVWRVRGIRPVEGVTLQSSASAKMPYALPIAVGAVVTIWFR
jgi:prepilin peptidase CpaA